MQEFYKDCFCNKSCPERCFDCAQPDIMKNDWIHSLGFYYPKFKKEYRDSKWSQAVIKAKKKSMPAISSFGRIVAHYMDKELADMKPYLITNVPAFLPDAPYLFSNFEICPTQILAYSVFSNLKDKRWISVEQLLVQSRKKAMKQHRCKTDTQRRRNIHGVYAENIILLDDVVTSGATMRECADELFEAGAKTVVGVTLARTFRIMVRSINKEARREKNKGEGNHGKTNRT